MATQTVTNLPPAYTVGIGEDFAKYFSGTGDITKNPYYVDPSAYTGSQFVAGQDQFTKDAQGLANP